jgi:hypothetical protein
MALDWAAYRARRGGARVRLGLEKRPFPGRGWSEMHASPAAHMPWPYSEIEAQSIRSVLPAGCCQLAVELAVLAARRYVHAAQLALSGKPNPRKEIAELRQALTKLCNTVMSLSPEARTYLEKKLRPVQLPDQEPFTVDSLRYDLDRFNHENRRGLEIPPPSVRGGPRARNHEAWLVWRLKHAFLVGHSGRLPKRGWPDFLKRCVTPLCDFGLPIRSDKAWQDVLRKRRNNLRKKR